MAKFVDSAVQEAGLDLIAATVTELYICNGQPTSRADAITRARHAAAIAMTAGDFVKSTVAGARRLTVAAKNTTANASGNVDHVALCTGSTLRYVTPAAAKTANNGDALGSSGFTIDAADLV
ncbi:hypothetical protein [Sandarakinorhabdus sp.]|uniref:hypothetical protein n=1 Tax=Sandarakinorhabdus sp. TaxID=1916663 RepID=UPI00286E702B|nr:hypothetical protein [Sandarakinorhabdus sp.]